MRYFEILVDSVFLIDVVVSSVSDDYSSPGDIVTNGSIFKAYATSTLALDLLGCLPGLITGERFNGG